MNNLSLIKYYEPDPSIPVNLRVSITKMQIANRCGMAGVEVNNISNTRPRLNDNGKESLLFNVRLPDDLDYLGVTDVSTEDGLDELADDSNWR